MAATNKEPYQQAYDPPRPTGLTTFMRRFLPGSSYASSSST